MPIEEQKIPEIIDVIKEEPKSKFDFSLLASGYYPYLIFTVLIALVFGEVIGYGFTCLDDKRIIIDHWEIISSLSNIKEAFLKDAFLSFDYMKDKIVGFYRPMQTITFMIDAQIGGKSPWIYHFTNLLLHLLTTFSVYKLIQKYSDNRYISLCLGCLFAVLPLFTHAVAWIPSRGDLLLGLFGVTSVIFLIKYIESQKWYYLLLHSLSFLFVVFSKESGVSIVPIYLFYMILIAKKRKVKDYMSYSFIWTIIIVLYLILRFNASMSMPESDKSLLLVFWSNLPVFFEYLSKMVIPFNLSVMPIHSIDSIIIGIVLAIGLVFIIISSKETRTILIWGLFWYFILIFPAMIYRGSGFMNSFDYLEHRSYLPLVGIFLLIALYLNRLIVTIKPQIIYSLLIVLIISYSLISFTYKSNYKDELTFMGQALVSNSKNVVALNTLGVSYYDKGDFQNAEKYYQLVLKEDTLNVETLNNLGLILEAKNDPFTAIKTYYRLLDIDPDFPDVYRNLGRLFYKVGDFHLAAKFLAKATIIDPSNAENYNLLGNSLNTLKEYAKAETALLRSIRLNPSNPYAFNNLGVTYYQLGDYELAISNFRKAIELDSRNALALKNIGYAYGRLNNEVKQIEYFKLAAKSGSIEIQNLLTQRNISW